MGCTARRAIVRPLVLLLALLGSVLPAGARPAAAQGDPAAAAPTPVAGHPRLWLTSEELPRYLARFGEPRLQPVLTTWYRRSALCDSAGRLRVTLDQRVCFCAPSQIGTACEATPRVLAEGPAFVLEVKSCEAPPAWLASLLRGVPEAVGFSKFESGMRSVAARTAAARWLAGNG